MQLFKYVRMSVLCVTVLALFLYQQENTKGVLRVTFLDVGQGDSILIETAHGVRVIVDGGKDATVLQRLGRALPLFDRRIDVLIATHPDADHVGGLASIVERYRVGTVYYSPMKHNTPEVTLFETALLQARTLPQSLRSGDVLVLDAETSLHILHPDWVDENGETNDSSVVARLVYRNSSVLLTGDASSDIEYTLAARYGAALKSSILKLGHHGSSSSSSEVFLKFVHPEHAIISRGCDNTYGHPHPSVIARLKDDGISSVDTCVDGTVAFESDGEHFSIDTW